METTGRRQGASEIRWTRRQQPAPSNQLGRSSHQHRMCQWDSVSGTPGSHPAGVLWRCHSGPAPGRPQPERPSHSSGGAPDATDGTRGRSPNSAGTSLPFHVMSRVFRAILTIQKAERPRRA